jgi:hypothetical protein
MDRRSDARFPPPRYDATRATVRPGCPVLLVDVSAGGALIEASRPLRPGARVHLQLVTRARTFALAACVLRCAVWSLDPFEGVTYRGALKFEDRFELFWDAEVPAAERISSGPTSDPALHAIATPASRFEDQSIHRSTDNRDGGAIKLFQSTAGCTQT